MRLKSLSTRPPHLPIFQSITPAGARLQAVNDLHWRETRRLPSITHSLSLSYTHTHTHFKQVPICEEGLKLKEEGTRSGRIVGTLLFVANALQSEVCRGVKLIPDTNLVEDTSFHITQSCWRHSPVLNNCMKLQLMPHFPEPHSSRVKTSRDQRARRWNHTPRWHGWHPSNTWWRRLSPNTPVSYILRSSVFGKEEFLGRESIPVCHF